MTVLGIDPDTKQLRWPKGSPYLLKLQISDGAGGFVLLTGQVLRFAAFRASGAVLEGTEAQFAIDGDTASYLFDGSVSQIPGLNGKLWQIASVSEAGPVPLFQGTVYVSAAADDQGIGAGAPPADLIMWNPAAQTMIVTSIGAPGAAGPNNLFIQPDAPTAGGPFVWVQPVDGGQFTIWLEDGA